MIPVILFFGFCFFGFGDCNQDQNTALVLDECPYDLTGWHQYKEIKKCVVKDNVLFEKYNRTDLPERIVYDDGMFTISGLSSSGSDLEMEIQSFYGQQLRNKLGFDYDKVNYITIHSQQKSLIDFDVFVDDPAWQEYTGRNMPWFYDESSSAKVYSSLSIANSTTVKMVLLDQKYRIDSVEGESNNSKIDEWYDVNGAYWIKFDGQPKAIYINVNLESNPHWQSIKYILNEKFDCGILVTFADGTQQIRNEIPDLGSKTITVIENPQFRDDVCDGKLQNRQNVKEMPKNE